MNNTILTSAVGLQWDAVQLFIRSLRLVSNKSIVYFILNKKDNKLIENLKKYNVEFYFVEDHRFDIQKKRFSYYLNILNNINNIDKVLLCDCRDIYFQKNIFDYFFKKKINFFSEDYLIKNCPFNSNWINKTFGPKELNKLSPNNISCSGTVLGDIDNIKKYLNLIIALSKDYPYKKRLKYLLTFRRDKSGRGCDQAYHNYIVYNNFFDDKQIFSNLSGPIATVYYLKNIRFNSSYELLNNNLEPYFIVHQYDKRWDKFSGALNSFRKKLNI